MDNMNKRKKVEITLYSYLSNKYDIEITNDILMYMKNNG